MSHLSVFIGWDSKEPIAFQVAYHSLIRRASRPVPVTALVQSALRSAGIYTRERGATESTEFSLTRFLCPHLCNYEGYSLFLDGDVVVLTDIWDVLLHALAYPGRAVYVCQHDYTPSSRVKFLGQPQTVYERKNWSSVMLFDNARCQALTPEYVNRASGLSLHRFRWLSDDALVGSLPLDWNWLVGEYPANSDARILHYTLGAPCFREYRDCDQSEVWWQEYRHMLVPLVTLSKVLTAAVDV